MQTETALSARPQRSQRETKGEEILQVLTDFCRELEPGDLVPPHQELMHRFGASERAVRWALNELRHQGRIVRRQGARTFVADIDSNRNGIYPMAHLAEPISATQNRNVVALAVPDHALFERAMKLLVERAKIDDISIICHLFPANQQPTLPQISEPPLGYIVFGGSLLPLAEELQSSGNRVVLVGTPGANATPAVPVVCGDQEYGGYLATKHLIELGHRRIAFCGARDFERTLRWRGHRRALREADKNGVHIQDSVLILDEMKNWKDNPSAGEAVFLSPKAPTGLVVWNDHEAVMVLGQLNRMRLSVPRDVTIVGYDNLPEGELVYPSLTTVYSSIEQQLEAALGLLTSPEPPPTFYRMVVLPLLISRDSSAALQLDS